MHRKSIVVLGGGISGLSAAWYAAKQGAERLQVVLLEGSSSFGGWIKSYDIHNGGVMEAGPRSLRASGPTAGTTLSMISELGLEASLLPIQSSHPAAKNRFIYLNKKGLILLPNGPSWFFQTKVPFSRPLLSSVLREPFQPASTEGDDESIRSFVLRRLGKEFADYLIDPMCRGIFAGDSSKLSIKSCFRQLYDLEKDHGSVIKGMIFGKRNKEVLQSSLRDKALKEKWSIYSFKQGLGELPNALVKSLESLGADLKLSLPCTKLEFTAAGQVQITTGDGKVTTADHVISSLPSKDLAQLLSPSQHHQSLRSELTAVPSVNVAVVNVEYTGQNVLPPQFVQSFGYLVPSHQKSNILGVVNDSATFPQHNRTDQPSTRLTVMMGGEWFEDLFGSVESTSEDHLASLALEALREQLGISQDPSYCKVIVQRACIPQYFVGHSARLERIREYIRSQSLPLTLIGSSYDGVSVNDCVHFGMRAAQCVAELR